jgi:hypothetical protein
MKKAAAKMADQVPKVAADDVVVDGGGDSGVVDGGGGDSGVVDGGGGGCVELVTQFVDGKE